MDLTERTILVTGAAGFIGFHVCRYLLKAYPSCQVVGLDSLSHYYDVRLKHARLAELQRLGGKWCFHRVDICDMEALNRVFTAVHPASVIHLAAQAGVRESVLHPETSVSVNVVGFANVLEACHLHDVACLLYASSSSVYGERCAGPFKETDRTDSPVSLYAATKKSNELMAHAYSSLYGIHTIGVRIFTAYGPWGRPDMAYFSFAEQWRRGQSVRLFNYGRCQRDFTYIDDVSFALVSLLEQAGLGRSSCEIFNLGGAAPVNLVTFVTELHECLLEAGVLPMGHSLKDNLEMVEEQLGDVTTTEADCLALRQAIHQSPRVALRDGLRRFSRWYADVWVNIKGGKGGWDESDN